MICGNLLAGQLPDPKYSLVKAESYVQSKNYYLLTLLERLPDVSKLLSNDPELSKIAAAKRDFLTLTLKNCGNKVSCYLENIRFTDSVIQSIGNRLFAI